MPDKTYTLADARPPTPEERARLDAMTDDEVEAAARSDPDAQPYDDAELERGEWVAIVKRARAATGLSQSQFAKRYRFNVRSLQNWESGRQRPLDCILAYLQVIEREGKTVERVLAG